MCLKFFSLFNNGFFGRVGERISSKHLSTIIGNYEPDATILLSTHLITDVENILDEVVFIKDGHITMQEEVETIRCKEGKSVDDLFREVFKC